MIKLYSKDTLVSAVTAMKRGGRMAHAFLLTGERGAGKKISADYIAMTLLCERGGDVPCGECRQCKRILENSHPDVIKPERTGKKQIYNRETIRLVRSDAFVSPNDCDAKVYIFTDCENIEESTQNLMLKLIEEPPDMTYFIFTAVSAETFLPTIRSRVIAIGIPECTETDCMAALTDMGFPPEKAEEAVRCFHGNIGNCLDYLKGGASAENVQLCKEITAAIAVGDEYALLAAVHKAEADKEKLRAVMELADKTIRDACVLKLEAGSVTGCDPEGALELSRRISTRRAELIHDAIVRVCMRCGTNMNVPAETAAFVCAVMG